MSRQEAESTTSQPSQFSRRYRLQALLGTGGMGSVYCAYDRLSGKYIALKRVLALWDDLELDSQADMDQIRFSLAREFEILASLRHPNIINVLDYGFDGNRQPYFTMDLLQNAQTITEAANGQSFETQLALFVQLIRALIYLHQRQILHRDLKPNNILVESGIVKVVDFGLSVIAPDPVSPGSNLSGTLSYLAPELLAGGTASVASDLYALGVVAYQMFTGQHLFEEALLITDLMNQIMHGVPDLAGLKFDSPIRTVIERLLRKSPQDRFKSAKDVFYALYQTTDDMLPLETESTRESFLQASRFVGRDKELSSLFSALEAAIHRKGSSYLIGGESGIGKSRLFREVKTRAEVQGTLVITGQAVTESATPYQLWSECFRWFAILDDLADDEINILRAVIPGITALVDRQVQSDLAALDPKLTQKRLHQTVEKLLDRQTEPLVILLEDLQWASEEDLALLDYLNQLAVAMPLLILGNFRDDERPDLPIRLPSMQLMQLNRLTEQEISTLSEMMLGAVQPAVVDLLVKQTEGNVYFLVEIVRALAEEAGQLENIGSRTLPGAIFTGGIQHIVERRLDQVPAEERDLLQLAAVSGREIDLPVLRSVVSEAALNYWLAVCTSAGVLEVNQNRWRFVHDKLREGVLFRLEDEQRRVLHRQVAIAIESAYSGQETQAARLAYHWHIAGNIGAEAHYALIAGQIADNRFAFQEANTYYTQALSALAQMPDSPAIRRTRIDVMIQRAKMALTLVKPAIYFEQLAEAERLVQTLLSSGDEKYSDPEDGLRIGRIQLQIGHAYFGMGKLPEAVHHYHEALRIGQDLNDPSLIAQPSAVLGRLFASQGKNIKAEPLLTNAESLLDQLHLSHQWARTVQILALVRAGSGYCSDGLAKLIKVREVSRNLNDGSAVVFTHTVACVIYLTMVGDLNAATYQAQEAIREADHVKDLTSLYMPYGYAAWVESRKGNQAQAAWYREQANNIASAFGGLLLWSESFFGVEAELEFNAGNHDRALILADQALNYAIKVDSPLNQVRMYRLLALLYTDSDPAKCTGCFATGLQIAETHDLRMEAMNIRVAWGSWLLGRGQVAESRPHLQVARTQFRMSDLPLRLAEVDSMLALIESESIEPES